MYLAEIDPAVEMGGTVTTVPKPGAAGGQVLVCSMYGALLGTVASGAAEDAWLQAGEGEVLVLLWRSKGSCRGGPHCNYRQRVQPGTDQPRNNSTVAPL